MCAIFGCVNIDISPKQFTNSLETMNHRGPDDEGYFKTKVNNYIINFGHKRLSIVDIKDGAQPMVSKNNSIVVVYNGEIYNAKSLRDELILKGYIFFSTNSDTEVLIHGFEEWGEDLPLHLDGMWSFAIFDKLKKKIFFSRDRFGEKPFFYFLKNKQLIFSSELIGFSKINNIDLSHDHNNFKKYCAYGFFPGDKTPYKFIKKLEPGTNLTLNLNNFEISIKKYWEYNINPDHSHNEIYWIERLSAALDSSVKDRMISDVPTGIFLSGGLDSSIISYIAQKYKKSDLNTFSISFEDKSFDESTYSRFISNLIKSTHKEKLIDTKNIKDINKQLMDKSSEPLSDSSLLSFYQLCQFASNDVKVALGGDAADELFGGYDTLKAMKYAKYVSKFNINKLHPAINSLISGIPSTYNYMSLKFKIQRFLRFNYFNLSIANSQWLSPLTIDEISYIFNEKTTLEDTYSETIDAWNKNNHLDDIDKSNEFYCKIFLPNQILVKSDRLSMMHSLELRSPFLSNEIVDISSKLPNYFKLKNNKSKYILKKTYENVFGKSFVHRKKIGFSSPLSRWFKNRDIEINIKSNFLSSKKDFINDKLSEHVSNKQENRVILWNLLNLDNFLSK